MYNIYIYMYITHVYTYMHIYTHIRLYTCTHVHIFDIYILSPLVLAEFPLCERAGFGFGERASGRGQRRPCVISGSPLCLLSDCSFCRCNLQPCCCSWAGDKPPAAVAAVSQLDAAAASAPE